MKTRKRAKRHARALKDMQVRENPIIPVRSEETRKAIEELDEMKARTWGRAPYIKMG